MTTRLDHSVPSPPVHRLAVGAFHAARTRVPCHTYPGRVVAMIAGLVLTIHPLAAQAHPITFAFTAVVDGVLDFQHLIYPDLVHAGSPFTGQFTFESTTPDATPDDPAWADYHNAIIDCEAQLGLLALDYSPTSTNNGIDVGNDIRLAPHVYRDLYGFSMPFDILGLPTIGGVGLTDYSATAWDSLALPEVPPPLDAFDYNIFVFNVQGGIRIEGDILSLTLVPEPTTFALVGFGATTLLARQGRRRR